MHKQVLTCVTLIKIKLYLLFSMNLKLNYFAFLIICISININAMPPNPDAWSRTNQADKERVINILREAGERGLNSGGINVLNNMAQIRRDDADEIDLKVMIILVDFDDNEADQDNYSPNHFSELLFSLDEYDTGSMRDWYLDNSLGEVNIIGEVSGWYRMPQDYAWYVNARYGLGGYPQNAQRLTEDAIRAADDDVDYSDYDNDGDGVVEAIFIVHAGGGAEQEPDNEDLIWSHAWQVRFNDQFDGVRFRRYTAVPENGKIGVFGHELGHAMFGLPDLYDIENESAGLGLWSMMAAGSWGGDGNRPTHFDAWSKQQLGWLTLRELEFDDEFILPPVQSEGDAVVLWNPDQRGNEYFIAEYRTRTGFDGAIPASGLTVYHIDTDMENNANPWWPDHEGNLHNIVALEQADGDWDLETFENYGDAGDPYPGNTNNRTFNADTTPNSLSYGGDDAGVEILEIQRVQQGISARWRVGVERPVEELTVELIAGWNFISANVILEDVNIINIFQDLDDRGNLEVVKDYLGRFYNPEFNFNNIPQWVMSEGYQVKVTENDELIFVGESIQAQTPIALIESWQIISYYPNYQLEVIDAFEGVIDNLIRVKDEFGNFYSPEFQFNNIPPLHEGRGYQVKMSADDELIYPEE